MHLAGSVKILAVKIVQGGGLLASPRLPLAAADETEFGEDRLLAVLAAHSTDDVATVHAAAMDAVRAFGAQHDDQTLLVARVL